MKNIECPYCEFHCPLTTSWSGICGMYRISKKEGNLKFQNRFYDEHKVSELYRTWIESVPIFHYKPGSVVLNIGTISCNFNCKYCINERFARKKPEEENLIQMYSELPERVIKRAKLMGASSIVFGQNEPIVSIDYVLDLARECRKNKVPFGISTNGFMSKESINSILEEGLAFVNMDIKSFKSEFLSDIIGIKGDLAKKAKSIFLRNLKAFYNGDGIEIIEVTTPVIKNLNDFEVIDIAKEINNIDSQIPYHIQRIVPEYEFKKEQKYVGEIESSKQYYLKAKEILDYVYFGAFPNSPFVNTICYECGELLINRADHGGCIANMIFNKLKENKCPNCGAKINVVN